MSVGGTTIKLKPEWVAVFITIFTLIIGSVYGYASLGNSVKNNQEQIKELKVEQTKVDKINTDLAVMTSTQNTIRADIGELNEDILDLPRY